MRQIIDIERFRYILVTLVLILTALLLCVAVDYGQDKRPTIKQYQSPAQPPNNEQPTTNSPLVVSPKEDYLIGASDVLEIKVEDAPELSGVYRLNANGSFLLPVVGRVSAEKKRTDEVSTEIIEKLRGGYLVNPIVTVQVRQSNSRAFFIQGAVRRPGIYQIEGHPSLLKLITIAGGLSDNYGSTAFVMREKKNAAAEDNSTNGRTTAEDYAAGEKQATQTVSTDETITVTPDENNVSGEDDKYELFQANINNLLRGNLEQNLNIEPGDIVHIPQTDVFFVAGEVKAPGSFPLRDGTTLRQAISLAQGTTFESATDKGIIFREDRSGKREEIAVNVGDVMSGKKSDIEILPNDIIIVPNSKKKSIVKSLGQSASGTLPAVLLRAFGVF